MSFLAKSILAVIVIGILLSSCATRACKVQTTKQKWKYYNNLQFGGGSKKRR